MNTAARKIAGIGMMPALPAPSSVYQDPSVVTGNPFASTAAIP